MCIRDSLTTDHRRRGFSGAGYHFYIRKNGDIKSLRPLALPGACLLYTSLLHQGFDDVLHVALRHGTVFLKRGQYTYPLDKERVWPVSYTHLSLNQPSSVKDDCPMGCKLLLYGNKVVHVWTFVCTI